MSTTLRSRFSRWIQLAVFIAAFCGTLAAQKVLPVTVERVEPASWRTRPSDVMLRLSGQHLDRVVDVKVKHKGVRVIRIVPQSEGQLIVCLRISSDAEPGPLMLQVSTPFLTTFSSVPMSEGNADVSLRSELKADK